MGNTEGGNMLLVTDIFHYLVEFLELGKHYICTYIINYPNMLNYVVRDGYSILAKNGIENKKK